MEVKKKKVLAIPGISRTMTQIQGLSRARNFYQISGLSRTFKDYDPNLKDFPGTGMFFPNSCRIFRIFKVRGNPEVLTRDRLKALYDVVLYFKHENRKD